jgi:hypothetical protein
MSRNYSSSATIKQRRRITFAWVAGLAILIVGLMVYQQTEILYVLSTLSVTALLIVVAFADLKGNAGPDASSGNDSAAIGTGTVESARITGRARRPIRS